MCFLNYKMILLWLCMAAFVYANPLVSYYKNPIGQIYFTAEAPAEFHSENLSGETSNVSLRQLNATFGTPVLLEDDFTVIFAPALEISDFSFSNSDTVDLQTYTVKLPFMGFYDFNDDVSLMVNASVGIYSDLKSISEDDFKMSWFGLCRVGLTDSIDVFAGLAYNREFGKDLVYPLAGLNWAINDEWYLGLVFPRPFISYKVNESLLLYAGLGPAGGEWDVENPLDSEDDQNYNFYFSGYRYGGGIELDINKYVTLYASAGSTFGRDYKIKNSSTTLIDTDVDDTFIATVGLAFFR